MISKNITTNLMIVNLKDKMKNEKFELQYELIINKVVNIIIDNTIHKHLKEY